MSISTNYNLTRPSLLLDFANSQQLDPRVTFSRSTTASYYDGKTSVLAEQNLTLNSQGNFTNAYWNKQNVTVTDNTVIAPDGTTTASTLTTSVGLATHDIVVTGTYAGTTAGTYTESWFIKPNTSNFVTVFLTYVSTQWVCATANLSTGTITQTGSSGASTYVSSSITASTNGYYRITLTYSITSTSGMLPGVQINSSATPTYGSFGIESWTALGTESVYIWGAQLEQRSSVTAYNATTTSALTNYIPQLLTAPINSPRFDFNPTTGESLGLLIEQSSTNLCTYSQDLSNAAWTKNNVTITNNANIAPDGTQTFNKLIESTSSSEHYMNSGVVSYTASAYTISIYAKSAERNSFFVDFKSSDAALGRIVFNLSTQTATIVYGTSASYSIISVGNGVYKCSFTATQTTTSTNVKIGIYNGNTSYTGDGYSGIYIWGAQLEALAFPTSYISTTSAQVTRAADVPLKLTGTNFTQWFNYQQGTIYCSFDTPTISSSAPNMAIWGIDNGTTGQYYVNKSTATISGYEGTNNASFGTITANTNQQSIYSYSNISGSASASGLLNGGSVGTITATTQSTLPTQLTLGGYITTSNQFTGHIKKFAFYSQVSTTAQQQSLTGS